MALWNTSRLDQPHNEFETSCLAEARSRLDDGHEREFVVDFHGIEQIRSSELNDLIALHAELRARGRILVLTNVAGTLGEIFELTRLNRLFRIESVPSQDSLQQSLSAS